MAEKQASLIERVHTSYQQLSLAAINLNIASEELSRAIAVLETALQKQHLGISAWTRISGGDDEASGYWWSRDIGYTQVGDKWAIALRSVSGEYSVPDSESQTEWPFNEAPRWMQVEAVGKIPDLIDKLTTQAVETAKKLMSKSEQAYQFALVIGGVNDKEDDWRSKLCSAMGEVGLDLSAQAIAQPEVEITLVKNELKILAPKRSQKEFDRDAIKTALKHLGYPDLRFAITFFADAKKSAVNVSTAGQK